MKKLIILSAIAMSGLIYNTANAQVGIRVGFHFGPLRVVYAHAPVVVEQAPVYNDSNDDYYYLPDVDAYYSVNEQCYYYNDGNNWVSAAYLPGAYRDYDWRNASRYEVRAPRPYERDDFYRSRYNGHQVPEWSHNNYNNNGYANRDSRDNNQHFDNRGQGGYSQPSRNEGGNNQHFDNRGQGNYQQTQPNRNEGGNGQHFDNRGQGSYSQPNRNGGGNGQHFDNRGQGGQPSNQNGGHERDTRGGQEHFTQNNPQGGLSTHRMTKF
jgi:hypothetical protein